MEIYKKLLKCRDLIKSTKVEKEGLNKFSGYKYFTPSQISQLVHDVCNEVGLLHLYSMTKNEFGYVANLIIFDTDKPEDRLLFTIPTSIPDIKATNEAQKLGGAVTYSERYLLMIAFDIVDNSLDFDTTENTQKLQKTEVKEQMKSGFIPEITDKFQFDKWDGNFIDGNKIKYGTKIYTISEKAKDSLNEFLERQVEHALKEQQLQDDLDFIDHMKESNNIK